MPRFAWVAFLVCPDCGCTWRGLLPNERPGVFGPVEEQCPDCELGLELGVDGDELPDA